MEQAAAILRAEIAAALDDRRHTAEETKWEEAAAHAAALTAAERERRAVDLASQRVQAMTRAVAANLNNSNANRNKISAANTGPSIAQMKVELQILRDEEEVRARRIASIEADIQGTQARIGQQAQAYEVVLRQIADVKTEFAGREVRYKKKLKLKLKIEIFLLI